jgi:glycosyltransferase involved in cell wall biosynthesis
MKILLSNPTMHRVGTWFRVFYLGKALVARGHSVTLLNVSASNHFKWARYQEGGVDMVETPRFWGQRYGYRNTRIPTDLACRAFFTAFHSYDILHMFTHHVNALVPGVIERLKPSRTRVLLDWDDLWTDGGLLDQGGPRRTQDVNYAIDSWCERNIKRFCDGLTVVSHDLEARARAHGMPTNRILRVPNGAAVDTFRPGDRATLRAGLGLPLGRRVAVFSGAGQYDLDMVLEGLKSIPPPERPLVVITGPNAERSKAMVAAQLLGEDVTVAGMVPMNVLVQYMAAADVGLIPYADKPLNRARWPIKLGDYLAAGLPVVTCDVGEMGIFLRQHPVGVATAPHPIAFGAGLRGLVARADLEALSARAREAAETTSWSHVAADLEAFYGNVRALPRSLYVPPGASHG